MDNGTVITAFVVAALLGAVIGFERHTATREPDVSAGPRTFALYGLWGAGSALLGELYGGAAFAASAAGFAALLLVGYVVGGVRQGDLGTTTEAAAFAVFVVGAMAFRELYVSAVAVTIGVAGILAFKDALHRLSERFSADDVRAFVQFGLVTAVALPLVPDELIGPFGGISPRQAWLMVVLVSGISLVGYATLRLLGSRGLALTGLAGGLVSSTAVALGFSRMSHTRAALRPALTAGILAAASIMYPRVLVEAGVIDRDLVASLAIPLGVPLVYVGAFALVWWRRSERDLEPADGAVEVRNPLTLATAVQFGLLYGLILLISKALLDRFSDSSLYVVGAVSGINDVDAITLSTANLVADGLSVTVGARVILLAVAVNTIVKAGMVISLGSPALRRAAAMAMIPAAVIVLTGWAIV